MLPSLRLPRGANTHMISSVVTSFLELAIVLSVGIFLSSGTILFLEKLSTPNWPAKSWLRISRRDSEERNVLKGICLGYNCMRNFLIANGREVHEAISNMAPSAKCRCLMTVTMPNDYPLAPYLLHVCMICMVFKAVRAIYFVAKNEVSKRKLTLSDAEIFHLSVADADVKFVSILLKYGLFQPSGEFSQTELLRTIAYLTRFIIHAYRPEADEDEHLETYINHAWSLLCEMNGSRGNMNVYNCRRCDCKSKSTRRYRRILLIARMLRAIVLKRHEDPSTENYVACLKFYFRIIPDPFVTGDEMQGFLTRLFKGEIYQESMREMTEVYAGLFHPESRMPFGPRSLKHLSRCAVRNQLIRERILLPERVNEMLIPATLKDLLLGDSELNL